MDNKYYHFTSYNALNNIMIEGLKPQKGIRCQSIGDDDFEAVFFSKGMIGSIKMYAYMFRHYYKHIGFEGDNEINKSRKKIDEYEELSNKRRFYKEIYAGDIEYHKSKIEKINLIRRFPTFNDYLGGYGCFLSIDKVDNISEEVPDNCCCVHTIPPTDINIIRIYNKLSSSYTNSREDVLAYFMNCVPYEVALNSVDEDNKINIENLYRSFYNPYCNPMWCDLIEIPLVSKTKTLV